MIPVDFYIAYVFAIIALISIPDPIVILTGSGSLTSGTKRCARYVNSLWRDIWDFCSFVDRVN